MSTYPCYRMRQHRLPTPRRPVQQHSPRRLDTRVQIDFGVAEWHRNELKHLLYARIHASEVGKTRWRWSVVLRYCTGAAEFCAFATFLSGGP